MSHWKCIALPFCFDLSRFFFKKKLKSNKRRSSHCGLDCYSVAVASLCSWVANCIDRLAYETTVPLLRFGAFKTVYLITYLNKNFIRANFFLVWKQYHFMFIFVLVGPRCPCVFLPHWVMVIPSL